MQITKTKTTKFTVETVALGFFKKSVFFRVRKEKHCWCCGADFRTSEDDTISLCTTDKGNKLICTPCAIEMADNGIKVGVNRLLKEHP